MEKTVTRRVGGFVMALEWRLRMVMAENGIWSGAELGRLLEDKAGYKISPPSLSALLNNEPKQVKTSTMDALCTVLECTPSDLWKYTYVPIQHRKVSSSSNNNMAKAANDNNFKKLPPI